MLNGISCLWKRLLICKLFSYNYTRIKLFMYFCLLHLYVCIWMPAQIDLVDITLLSDSNCWLLFFRSVFFYFESCTASMTPIELPPKIKIRHVSIQGREWVGVGSVLYICIFGPASIRISQNYCNDNVTPFCSRFRNSLSWFFSRFSYFRLQWVKIM